MTFTNVRKRLPKQLFTFQRLPSARPKGLSGNGCLSPGCGDRVQKRFLTIFISRKTRALNGLNVSGEALSGAPFAPKSGIDNHRPTV